MNNLYTSKIYIDELKSLQNDDIFSKFDGKSILLSGGTGLILSYFIDVILLNKDLNVKIYVITRNIENAKQRFSYFINDNRLTFIEGDVNSNININLKSLDYVISGASKTDPLNYSKYPVEVLIDNIFGCYNLIKIALKYKSTFLLLSSCEVYGINNDSILNEDSKSIINILENRSSYNLAKMSSENMCINFMKEYDLKTKIIRFSRIFGPTLKSTDTKALSQFLFSGINGQNIVLKSKGEQKFSYQYVGDAVRAISYVLLKESDNVVFNSTNDEVYKLKELASFIAKECNVNVIFQINDEFSGTGYSKAINSILSINKLKNIGFNNKFNIKYALYDTIKIFKEIKK